MQSEHKVEKHKLVYRTEKKCVLPDPTLGLLLAMPIALPVSESSDLFSPLL